MGTWACEQVLGPFEELGATDELREAALSVYERELSSLPQLRVPASMLDSRQPLLRLPVCMPSDEQADEAISAIARLGLYAVPWYRPLLYPGVSDLAAYGFDGVLDAFPHTAQSTQGALALPCDLTAEQATSVAAARREIVSR